MQNEKQIVLFLEKNTEFSEIKIASEIFEKYPVLNSPITIPYESDKPNNPLIIFNKGLMQVTMNRNDLSFIFKGDDAKECMDIIEGIMDLLDDNRIEFIRIGYVSSYIHTKKEKTSFIKNLLKDQKVIGSEFNLAWYKEELIDSVKVNVWERHLTDTINNVEFLTIMDINTPMDKELNITSEFTIDFIKNCDKFIKKTLDERF